jgi:hypothetical protein
LLERPPARFRIVVDPGTWLPDEYWEKGPEVDQGKFSRAMRMFDGPAAVVYPIWFN